MERLTQLPKSLRQRRLLLVLPLLFLPFLTLLFWALGGGQTAGAGGQEQVAQGLNRSLPDAQLAEGLEPGKLDYYKKAAADSARFRDLLRKDSYAGAFLDAGTFLDSMASRFRKPDALPLNEETDRPLPTPGTGLSNPESREAQVRQKLAQLQATLQEPPPAPASGTLRPPARMPTTRPTAGKTDVDALARVLDQAHASREADPQIQQLDGMLDKILDIQHPERVRERQGRAPDAGKEQAFSVVPGASGVPVSLLGPVVQEVSARPDTEPPPEREDKFQAWEEDFALQQMTMRAIVPETQTLVTGAAVRLQLAEGVQVSSIKIPKGSFLSGTASLEGERLKIRIRHIRVDQALVPVALSVYDLDGLEGIYIPGSMVREVAGQSAERTLQGLGFSSLNPSLEVQAAGVGLEAVKSLFRKKAKQVKVTVRAGYQVLLRDMNPS